MMRDKETSKDFVVDRYSTIIEINGYKLSPDQMTKDPVFSYPTQHCYCLCLSNKKDSDELFDRFNADICIEIDADKLIEILNFGFSHKLKGMKVEAKEVTYYDQREPPPTQNPKSLVFFKPMVFSPEEEYRIALFYPIDKTGFKADDNEIVPFYKDDESMHLEFSNPDPSLIKQCIMSFSHRGLKNA